MKIVHVMNWYMPNMGYQENYLPAEQKKLGHDVEIVTSDRFPFYRGYKQHIGKFHKDRIVGTGIVYDNGLKIHRLPCFLEHKRNGEIFLKDLRKKLKKLNPDVVHVHGVFTPLSLQTIFYKKKLNYQLIVDDHSHKNNFGFDSFPKKIYIFFFKLFYQFFQSRVSCFMPVTYSSKEIIQSILKIPDEKIKLLHLGANADVFKPSKKLREIGRKENGIQDNEILILTSGKFTRSKDIDILLRSFINISKKFSNIRLLLVGNGPVEYMKYLEEIVDSSKINDKVIFHDFVPNFELPKLYNASDIGVWPGDHTITAIEAVATGLPIIVPSSDYAYKVLFEDNAALGFDRGSIDSLTKKIELLCSNRNKLDYLLKNSIEISQKKLGWNIIAKKSLEYYSK